MALPSVEELRSTLSVDLIDLAHSIYTAPLYHLLLEALLLIWILKLVFSKSYIPEDKLTDKEKEQLLAEWEPEPLVPDTPVDLSMFTKELEGVPAKRVVVDGKECLNLSTLNFMGMLGKKEIEDAAINTIERYGVGSCGPRGFYGTADVHLELEQDLANFFGCEEAILYSYGFATIASAIPAYAKKGDVVFADESCCFAIQKGLQASRSKVVYFKHNDMDDLERKLKEQEKAEKKNPKKAKVTRKFMVVEGLYFNRGDLCPLPELISLKYKYKVRLFVEESMSFGVLGASGRGITEHYGVEVEDIDMIAGSLEYAIGSIGGFCVGSSYVIDHQRLSGLGYCFSASLPPMLATAASVALTILDKSPHLFKELEQKCEAVHSFLEGVQGLHVIGSFVSPIKHLYLAESAGFRQEDMSRLREITETCFQDEEGAGDGVRLFITQAAYLEDSEENLPPPSIRLSVNVDMTMDELRTSCLILKRAAAQVFST